MRAGKKGASYYGIDLRDERFGKEVCGRGRGGGASGIEK